ncbi:MAG: hypothetical protein K8H86_03840 [Ignavibacteriaceae bacterium]|nr:hypothetical protein [Ignavibacteriaceae bacterium]
MEKLLNSKQLLDEIDTLSNLTLKRRDDLFALFQVAAEAGLENELEETAFTAKYVMGLLRVIKVGSQNPGAADIENVKKDLTSNLEKVKGEIRHIIKKDELLKVRFESEYFTMNQTAFSALNELLFDLEWTKKYYNILKRSKKN